MKNLKTVLAFALALGIAGIAHAGKKAESATAADAKPAAEKAEKGEKKAKAAKAVKGKVVKVDGDKLVIAKGKNAEEVTITTDANTKITIEGKAAKLADLQAGQMVSVSPADGTATEIVVAAPKKEKAAK
jgi:hypothetical protein